MHKLHSSMRPAVPHVTEVSGDEGLAREAAKQFAREVRFPMRLSRVSALDRDGLFAFRLRTENGGLAVVVELPGLPLNELRRKDAPGAELHKVLVNGISDGWERALERIWGLIRRHMSR